MRNGGASSGASTVKPSTNTPSRPGGRSAWKVTVPPASTFSGAIDMLPSCACGSGDVTCTLAPVLDAKQSVSTNGAPTAPAIVPPAKQQPVIAIGAVPPVLTAQLSNRASLQVTVCAGLVAS